MTWRASDIPSQQGRTAIVTGFGGLGYETGLALVRAGADVVLAGRNAKKGRAAVGSINGAVPGGRIRFELLDLASLHSVAAFAKRMIATDGALDILINNAGVMTPPQRHETSDGFELQFGTNYLGHFALTMYLLPLLLKAPAARVVNLSSLYARQGVINFDDLQGARSYRPGRQYGESKLAMLMFARELDRRARAAGLSLMSNAAHPGFARTDLVANGRGTKGPTYLLSIILKAIASQSAADGALPTLYAATSPQAAGGSYYGPSGLFEMKGPPKEAFVPGRANDQATARRLWEVSESMTGTRFTLLASGIVLSLSLVGLGR